MITGTSNAEISARARIASRLLPFLFLLYITNYLDRANLAYAALGMSRDLGLSDSVFGTAAGIFFIGYLSLQIPGAILVERWSARLWLAGTLITWGALTTLTGWVHSAGQLYVARFVLGMAEAGFFPGVIVYLGHWFVYEDRARAVARFMSAIPVSFIIGSPLAGKLLGVHWLGLPGWRWLFLMEGIPAVALGIVTAVWLPDRPGNARWLSPAERECIAARLRAEKEAKSSVKHYGVLDALTHPPVLLLSASLLFSYTAGYAFVFWFPTMLKRASGWTDLRVGLVGTIPYLAGFVGMQIFAWSSDRMRERRWHFAVTQVIAIAGLCLLLGAPGSLALAVTGFTFIGMGIECSYPCFWSLPGALLTDASAAAAVGFINSFASIGGYIGPKVLGTLSQHTAGFAAGYWFMLASYAIAALVVLLVPGRQGAISS
ncbi:MAG: MFS transporter [Acidobacteria bacterium]|nr:MFS transporter [Acidobacteriota bacterium]